MIKVNVQKYMELKKTLKQKLIDESNICFLSDVKKDSFTSFRFGRLYPYWFRFFMFLKRGEYQGYNFKIKLHRVFCWFSHHQFSAFLYGIEINKDIDGEMKVRFAQQCCHCGSSRHFYGSYKGYGQHRVEQIDK